MKRMTREEKMAEVAKRREVLQAQRLEEFKKAAEETKERVRLANEKLEEERKIHEARLEASKKAKELEEAERLRKVQEIARKEADKRRQERIKEVRILFEKQKLLEEAEKAEEAKKAKEEAEAVATLVKQEQDKKRQHRNWSKVPVEFHDKVTLGDLEDVAYLIRLQRAVAPLRRRQSVPSSDANHTSSPALPSSAEAVASQR